MNKWLYLILGSIAGGALRFGLAPWLDRLLGMRFPFGILAVNSAGCFLIGLFHSMLERKAMDPRYQVLLMAGFCGAFTTFSTFILDSWVLYKMGAAEKAFLNVGLSLLGGFAMLLLGSLTARWL